MLTFKNKGNRRFRVAALTAAVALVSACSSPSDPDGGTTLASTSVSGVAVDGYIASATVYADLNNDGRLDAGEPSAITDIDGYFTTSKAGADYCAAAATEKHCLQLSGTVPDSVTLRTSGGFDVFTGEPFIGELSAIVSPDANGDVPNQNITPLSSLGNATSDLLAALGLNEGQINIDFIDESSFDAAAANAAFKLHKVAVIFSEAFEDAYDYFGDNTNFPDGAATFIYDAFASELAGGAELDSDVLDNVFDAVDARVVSTFNSNRDDDESPISSRTGSSRTGTIANAAEVLGLIDSAVPATGLTAAQIRARMIGVETVVYKMIDDNPSSSEIQAAIAEVQNVASDLYGDDALGDGFDIDFTTLTELDFSSNPDFDSVRIDGGITLEDISDKELYLEISDTAKQVTGAALLLFDGESSESTSGDLKVCIRYDDADDERDYESDGVLFKTGEWSKIDDRRVILSLLGGFDFTLISRGVTDTNENLFSMSFAGDTETWTTSSSLEDIHTNSNAMDTHDDCKARLNELDS